MERVKGIEPSQSAWKAGALPLSYTRKCLPLYYISLYKNFNFYINPKIKKLTKDVSKNWSG